MCGRVDGVTKTGILLAKLLDGHPASFVRSEGKLLIVSVNGQERPISRESGDCFLSNRSRNKTAFIISMVTVDITSTVINSVELFPQPLLSFDARDQDVPLLTS